MVFSLMDYLLVFAGLSLCGETHLVEERTEHWKSEPTKDDPESAEEPEVTLKTPGERTRNNPAKEDKAARKRVGDGSSTSQVKCRDQWCPTLAASSDSGIPGAMP
jgi:hypothetical protein